MTAARSTTVQARPDARDPRKDVVARVLDGEAVSWLALVRPTAGSAAFARTGEPARASAFDRDTAVFVAANLQATPPDCRRLLVRPS
jgi:hypothetical protein